MIYLNDGHIRQIGTDWPSLAGLVERTASLLGTPEAVQPLKPYLRFREPGNRIIAMPAFVGGDTEMSGIKWIASFPDNVRRGLPRAHGSIVLNDPGTGVPVAFLCGGRLNELRTAAVSAAMLRAYFRLGRRERCKIGIIGWGPIGRMHDEMMMTLFGDRIESVRLFDVRGIDPETVRVGTERAETTICDTWQEAYRGSDIIVTCTVAPTRYIDERPAPGSLLLNVSLRDYEPKCVTGTQVVVDSWPEVCRENTDVEQLHLQEGLREEETLTLTETVGADGLRSVARETPIFFNPMGMAAFDIAVAAHYWREAERMDIGVRLEA
jgi:2,3-diaminopropionate biosynthesis protein SbnB